MIVLHCRKPRFPSLPVSPPIYRSKSAKFKLCIMARRIIIFGRTVPGHICSLFFSFSKCGRTNNAKSAFQYTVYDNTTWYEKKKKKKRKNNVYMISRLSWSFVKEFVVSSYRWSYALKCTLTQDLWEPWHILGDEELAWSKVSTRWGERSGGKLLSIHSLKWNTNDVVTTCKAVSKGLASGFVYWSCTLRQKP